MSEKYRILIAEDHTLMRVGLRALLAQEPDFEIAGEASNGRDAMRLIPTFSPHVILMDLTMPGSNGIETIAEIKRRYPDIKILVLTLHKADEYVHESLRAGADGYILKDATHDELRVALRSVLNGKTYLSPDISNRVVSRYLRGNGGNGATSTWDTVTHRERQVLKLVAEGRPNKNIAQYLSLSVKTVEKHRSNLMRKLDLHNASMLTAFAIEKGLVVTGDRSSVNGRSAP
ncbi:MAG: two component transcriptional regulator, LuxR family [Betaproteobacteria bacterium]|nr:two component transcriptional regulator, LuxR family [Betaproteobacteria bacterium]